MPTPTELTAEDVRKQSRELLVDAPLVSVAKAAAAAAAATEGPTDRGDLYRQSTEAHPFVHRAHYHTSVGGNAHICDAHGNVIAVVMKNALPAAAAAKAAQVLRPAATRTSLRASIFGGEAPLSGIAGYFDYAGSPIEHKCRKTSFTNDAADKWPDVFPMVDYINALYQAQAPDAWTRQHAAIPDAVRVHGSVFSTLTINQRFRTAQHTDAGDFDSGFGMITVLDGDYDGLQLGFPRHGVSVQMRVGDVMMFNTHHFHANTELERDSGDWSRVTCVLYYRANLGAPNCTREYQRRLAAALAARLKAPEDRSEDEAEAASAAERFAADGIKATANGVNLNRPATVFAGSPSPVAMLGMTTDTTGALRVPSASLISLMMLDRVLAGDIHNGTTTISEVRLCASSAACHDMGKAAESFLRTAAGVGQTLPRFLNELIFGEPWGRESAGDSFFFPRASASQHGWPAPAAPEGLQSPQLQLAHAAVCMLSQLSGEGLGLKPRDENELATAWENLKNPPPSGRELAPSALGGFSDTAASIELPADKTAFLDAASLRVVLPEGLHEMWTESRTKWLALVQRDWLKQHGRNPQRVDFSWANKSDMNQAFFDLCDVAHGVMQSILDKEDVTAQEETRFWLVFAKHLHQACQEEIAMPAEAMSMRKLNVKLKDHRFGGTRYFKDQSPEEQARRVARKERITKLRRANGGRPLTQRKAASGGRSWLDIDHFDYQTEDGPVEYGDQASGLPEPSANAQSVLRGGFTSHIARRTAAHAAMRTASANAEVARVRILVVGRFSSPSDPAAEPDRRVLELLRSDDGDHHIELWRRLSADCGAAVRRLAPTVAEAVLRKLTDAGTELLGAKLTDAAVARWCAQLRECSRSVADAIGLPAAPAVGFDWRHWAVTASVRCAETGPGEEAHADGKKRRRDTPTSRQGAAASDDSDDDANLLVGAAGGPPSPDEAHASAGPVALKTEVTLIDSRFAFGPAPLLTSLQPGAFDLVVLRNVFDEATDAGTAQEAVRKARRFCAAEGEGPGGALIVQQSDGADPYQFMLPQRTRKATDAATPVAVSLAQRALELTQTSNPNEGAPRMPAALPLALRDLERLLLLPPGSPAGARVPSASASGETIPEFLGVYRVPRSVLGTVLAVPPVL